MLIVLKIVAFIIKRSLVKLEAIKYHYMDSSAFSYKCFLALSNERYLVSRERHL